MSFNRLIYDEGAYQKQLNESTGVGQYKRTPHSRFLEGACFDAEPGRYNKAVTHPRNVAIVDVESELHNLNRKYSKNPLRNYPYVKGDTSHHYAPSCDMTLQSKYGRLDDQVPNREQSIQVPRFESLALNPQLQHRIHDNSYIGRNTRLWERDNYKPFIHDPICQKPAFPKGGPALKAPMCAPCGKTLPQQKLPRYNCLNKFYEQ